MYIDIYIYTYMYIYECSETKGPDIPHVRH